MNTTNTNSNREWFWKHFARGLTTLKHSNMFHIEAIELGWLRGVSWADRDLDEDYDYIINFTLWQLVDLEGGTHY